MEPEPATQYCVTADGVTIAYAVSGSGPPLVFLPAAPNHLVLDWRFDGSLGRYRWLGERFTLIRLDQRNTGLSQRGTGTFDYAADIEAVVGKLALERFVLMGTGSSSRAAIRYAASHPLHVEKLVLWQAYASPGDILGDQRLKGLFGLLDGDWEMFTEIHASLVGGWEEGERAREHAVKLRESITQEDMRRAAEHDVGDDVSGLLGAITAPTLVVNLPQSVVPLEAARRIVTAIPNAHLQLVEGKSVFVRLDTPQVEPWLDAFLRGPEPPAVQCVVDDPRPADARPDAIRPSVATILFTDLAASTALTQRLGDAQAQDLLRAHNAIVREALQAHGGHEIKHTGDGIMASFPTASGALDCAVAIQRAVAGQDDGNLQVHVGLNAVEPVAEDADLFGTAVQLARRICDEAAAGEILVSNVVRELAAGKNFLFADRGASPLKGFEDAVRLYQMRWREEG
jgi:class 3 adenylate cyclase